MSAPNPGRTVVVTGATDGIGRQTAFELAPNHSFHVLVHGRTQQKALDACQALKVSAVTPVWGDFSVVAEVRSLAEQIRAAAPVLDVLVTNAGASTSKT